VRRVNPCFEFKRKTHEEGFDIGPYADLWKHPANTCHHSPLKGEKETINKMNLETK